MIHSSLLGNRYVCVSFTFGSMLCSMNQMGVGASSSKFTTDCDDHQLCMHLQQQAYCIQKTISLHGQCYRSSVPCKRAWIIVQSKEEMSHENPLKMKEEYLSSLGRDEKHDYTEAMFSVFFLSFPLFSVFFAISHVSFFVGI